MDNVGIDTTNHDEVQRLAREIRTLIGAPPSDDVAGPDLVFQGLLQVIKDEREACLERVKQFCSMPGTGGLLARQILVSLQSRGLRLG